MTLLFQISTRKQGQHEQPSTLSSHDDNLPDSTHVGFAHPHRSLRTDSISYAVQEEVGQSGVIASESNNEDGGIDLLDVRICSLSGSTFL